MENKTTIYIDASDYYGGTVYGVDDTGREWHQEQDSDIWFSDDNLNLTANQVIEEWIGK